MYPAIYLTICLYIYISFHLFKYLYQNLKFSSSIYLQGFLIETSFLNCSFFNQKLNIFHSQHMFWKGYCWTFWKINTVCRIPLRKLWNYLLLMRLCFCNIDHISLQTVIMNCKNNVHIWLSDVRSRSFHINWSEIAMFKSNLSTFKMVY